ncbi:double-strand-break repair protein rad21 homolog [Limulus polyphemus]|uniref:Double-strand-break repair protein rad21 homolog n=1 Tax=Limulus polyphemus TaxID=6850 RepID=A0ABM1B9C5_LIMPO|nr:double-strand-break repair protein rad21 homolog [Limulus polyphemus]XP_013777470.1 double-strand-break repair protein rad21 homolog [Limulus polyphemus]
MFYAHFVLAKKGPLARIWLAAHWDKKLTKAHVFETNIESSVEGILQPKVKMALRTSGHLLLGIVRIYSRKAKYLLADCNEAFIKIKMAFRPGIVDLPEENREAAVATITLPEVFHDFDTAMPDMNNLGMETPVTLNQSRAEDITLKEDYGTLTLMADDGFGEFGDMGFDDPELARDATNIDEGFDHASLLLGEDRNKDKPEDTSHEPHEASQQGPSSSKPNMSLDAPLKDDGFGGTVGEGLLEGDAGLFEPTGLFDDAPLGHVPMDTSNTDNPPEAQEGPSSAPQAEVRPEESDDDDDVYDMGPSSMGGMSAPSTPGSVPPPEEVLQPMQTGDTGGGGDEGMPPPLDADHSVLPQPDVMPQDQTTLIHNEEETFALAPLDATIVQGAEKAKGKRKRKLVVDEVKNISGEEMKSQLSDTTDIVTTLDLAPPTKRLMHWKETGGVEKLFALPGRPILSKTLSKLYQRHLTSRPVDNEEFGLEEDKIDLDGQPEQLREEEVPPHKRRREMVPEELSRIEQPQLETSIPVQPMPPVDQSTPHLSMGISTEVPVTTEQLPPLPVQESAMLPPQVVPESLHPLPPVEGHQLHPVEGHPLRPIEGYPLHQVEGHQLHQVEGHQLQQVEGHPLHHVEGHPLHHVEGHPLHHVEGHPLHHVEGHPLHPIDGHQLHSVDGHPLHSVDGQLLNPMEGHPLPLLEGHPLSVLEGHQTTDILAAATTTLHDEPCIQQQQPLGSELEKEQEPQQEEFVQPTMVNHKEQTAEEEEDYAAPASVGPPEEQLADETYEQFEERILNKRTVHMLHLIQHGLEAGKKMRFSDLVRNNMRKQVAQKFYTFLVLKKQQAVELEQSGPYGEIIITRGSKFNGVY